MNNLELWDSWKQPPANVLKQFTNGRYNGTDISPQWRYQKLTETYGPIGIGWYYTIDKQWTEPGADGNIMAFTNISLFIKNGDKWSMPIPGSGGNSLVKKESKGLFTSDEGYKMAKTDAISDACKMLGIGADIYLGNFDGSKYVNEAPKTPTVDELKKVCEQRYIKLYGQIDGIVRNIIDKLETVEEIKNWMVQQKINKDYMK